MSMLRTKLALTALTLAVIASVAAPSHAATTTATVMMAGSSAQWQTLALGAYNSGTSTLAGGGITCHWTSKSNGVNLVDSRPTVANTDPGTLWIVWDNNTSASTCAADGTNTTTHVWAYLKNDSVIGVRCYQANPKCKISASSLTYAQQITLPAPVWGADAASVPAGVTALFTTGTLINSAASDIRPEDAAFAMCRVNSSLGASAQGSGKGTDNLDGLGYNSNNASGVCPAYNSATKNTKGVGTAIQSGVNTSTGSGTGGYASVLAFNLSGKDPITNSTVTFPTVTDVGAAPIVFVVEHDKGQLTGAVNATDAGLQAIFSGTDCNGNQVGGGGGGINVFLREPTSGTMNTTEATVFRYPTTYGNHPNTPGVAGKSQETGVGANNPLATACAGGGGTRYRGVSTSEIIKDGVALSGSTTGCGGAQCYTNAVDGIGYTFFSYGNVSALSDKAAFGYLMLDGVDPIFQSYFAGASGSPIDPGQNTTAAGEIPGAADLPASCGTAGAFPCNERFIWGGGLSFPNLRNGKYRAWSLLRVLGAPAAALATASNKYNVTTVPDYVPAATVTAANGGGTTDPGFELLRSHYIQYDGAGTALEKVPAAVCLNTVGSTENCGDMGGEVLTKGQAATNTLVANWGLQIVSSMSSEGYSSPYARASTGD